VGTAASAGVNDEEGVTAGVGDVAGASGGDAQVTTGDKQARSTERSHVARPETPGRIWVDPPTLRSIAVRIEEDAWDSEVMTRPGIRQLLSVTLPEPTPGQIPDRSKATVIRPAHRSEVAIRKEKLSIRRARQ
jgi:hypothetical protein